MFGRLVTHRRAHRRGFGRATVQTTMWTRIDNAWADLSMAFVVRAVVLVVGWALVGVLAIIGLGLGASILGLTAGPTAGAVGFAAVLLFFAVTAGGSVWMLQQKRRGRPDSRWQWDDPHRASESPASYLALPLGWAAGLSPTARGRARAYVRDSRDILFVAHDTALLDRQYVPTLSVRSLGPFDLSVDSSDWLDSQERILRDGFESATPAEVVDWSLRRVTIPAGESICAEFTTPADKDDPEAVSQVQYYLPCDVGVYALWFACLATDLPAYRSGMDEITRTFMSMERFVADVNRLTTEYTTLPEGWAVGLPVGSAATVPPDVRAWATTPDVVAVAHDAQAPVPYTPTMTIQAETQEFDHPTSADMFDRLELAARESANVGSQTTVARTVLPAGPALRLERTTPERFLGVHLYDTTHLLYWIETDRGVYCMSFFCRGDDRERSTPAFEQIATTFRPGRRARPLDECSLVDTASV
jgi:hypothetical protein